MFFNKNQPKHKYPMTELEQLQHEETLLRTKLRENNQRQHEIRRADFLNKHDLYVGKDVLFAGRKAKIVDVEDVGEGVLIPIYVRFKSDGQTAATRQKIWPQDMNLIQHEDSY